MPRRIARAMLLLLVAAAACGRSPVPGPAAPPAAAFCDRLTRLMELSGEIEDPQEYPRLVAAYESAIAVAPPSLAADLAAVEAFYRSAYEETDGTGSDPYEASRRITTAWQNRCP